MINNIVIFTHPSFLGSASMPRFSKMITEYLTNKKIKHEVWSPKELLITLAPNSLFAKWLGYIDQYIIFPFIVRKKLRSCSTDTLFVFCDQALGPWVPLVSDRPHVIHCHDFMALKSALGLIPENPTSFTGRIYQNFIRRGFKKGKNFISISKQTQSDLYKYGGVNTDVSKVVYNGLNYPYKQQSRRIAFRCIADAGLLNEDRGCLLHIGGGQWYKNTSGIIKLYGSYCMSEKNPKPLILVSPSPKGELLATVENLPGNASIKFIQGVDVELIEALYSYADALLFPSLAEGFGWPIIEAQACGCPVITTNKAPMNEIGGPVSGYLERYSSSNEKVWLESGLKCLLALLNLNKVERSNLSTKAIKWASGFDGSQSLDSYLSIYTQVLHSYENEK